MIIQLEDLEESGKDYSALYSDNANNMLDNKIELHDIYKEKNQESEINKYDSDKEMPGSMPITNINNDIEFGKSIKIQAIKSSSVSLIDITDTFDILNKEMQSNDFFTRLIAINLSIEEDKAYDFDMDFSKKMKSFLPWEDHYYKGKSKFEIYSQINFPEWLKISNKGKLYIKSHSY